MGIDAGGTKTVALLADADGKVVGEGRAKLLVYLVATSRKLGRPLSLVVVSRSEIGRASWRERG